MLKPSNQERARKLLSLACKAVLILMPILFVYGHVRAVGVTWNYATGEKFDPWVHHISYYAYRSPAWWAIVSCMMGVAFLLGVVAWRAAGNRRSLLAWITAAAAAIGMFKMVEATWYSESAPEITLTRMQEELDKGPIDQSKDEIGSANLKVTGQPVPGSMDLREYQENLRSSRLHTSAIKVAQVMIFVTMIAAFFQWQEHALSRRWWLWLHGLVVLTISVGILGAWWWPSMGGLHQRVVFGGVYFWLGVVVFAIDRERRRAAAFGL